MDEIQRVNPDLTLFYKFPPDNKDDYAIDATSRNFVNYIGETPIYATNEYKNKIGFLTTTGTLNIINRKIFDTCSISLTLPEGQIFFLANSNDSVKEIVDNFFPSNSTLTYPILNGNGDFTFVKGWIVISALPHKKRIVYLYFDK